MRSLVGLRCKIITRQQEATHLEPCFTAQSIVAFIYPAKTADTVGVIRENLASGKL